MDRYQRWGKKAEQRQEQKRYEKHPQHARVPLRIVHCVDCLRQLAATHPAHLEGRCGSCWKAVAGLVEYEGVEGYA